MADELTAKASPKSGDEALLKQIREDFTYAKEYWRENHEQSEKDMDCIAGTPPDDFAADRAGRPCIWPDEISQYIKQANNNLRQNKRSIKISPRSEDATDQDAEHRQAYIRGIEYASQAQSVYSTAFEACVESAFGFWRVTTKVTGPKGEQEPRIKRIPNQFTVYPDPDAMESDFSDSNTYFVIDTMRQSTFASRYPKAQKRSFGKEEIDIAPGWFHGENIVVAEAWKRKEISEGKHEVTQRITNGVEVLETNKWLGSWIPIIGMFGEEIYVRKGGQSKRMFMSLVRRMRAPQQMLAYVASQEMEEFQMAPRAPFIVFKGSVDSERWKNAHKVPVAYLEYTKPQGWSDQWGPPPAPQRPQFLPNIEAYEAAYERIRRSIQAAAGITPLPTAAQRQNEKSGIALEKIQTQEAIGSFHFTDNFSRSLANTGRQLNELITKLAKTDSLPAQLLGKDQKDEDIKIKVASSNAQRSPDSEHLDEADQFFAHVGEFEETVSDGPSYLSEREEASAFADTLLEAVPKMGLPPQLSQEILAIATKLKNIGVLGQEIVDLLSPPDPNKLPPQFKAMMSQMQAQNQELSKQVQVLMLEKLGKVTETKGKMAMAEQEHGFTLTEADKDRETKVLIAEIETKAQDLDQRMTLFGDMMKQWHDQAHDIAMQMQGHQQAKELQAQAAQDQSAQSSQDAGQQSAQSAQDHVQTSAQQQQAAEQQPSE